MDPLLDRLTDAQRQAVQHVEGPLLILAGPGSGKTRVVTHRVAYLIREGIPSSQILALTFTNKAAEEMRSRLAALAPDCSAWVSTFHRFCARLLRKYGKSVGLQENYTIYDADDSVKALRQVLARLHLETPHVSPEAIAAAISWAKNRLISPEQYSPRPGHPLGALVERVYPVYQAQLARANAADFDDLLLHTVTLLRENPEIRASLDQRYRFVLVDEYQDTNLAQYVLSRALSIDCPNLAVTGDPDQSIYGWRGANLNNILEFERDFPEVRVIRLEQNYRSTKRILRVAAGLISHNVKRKQKDLFTENGEGVPVRLVAYATHRDEAQGIASRIAAEIAAAARRPRDYAVFYRVNALSRAFELALREHGVPYQLINGLEFFQRKEIKDVLAYLRLINNPRDDVALARIINAPARGIGKTTLQRLAASAAGEGVPLLEAARHGGRVAGLGAPAAAKVLKFVELVDRLTALAGGSLEELLGHVLFETGYRRQFEGSTDEDDQQRLANIEELLTVAREFDERHSGEATLEAFLEETSLVADTDDFEAASDRLTLMTLHSSKGLEFPVVYMVAVEEGLLPHERSAESPGELEEERRLMFVGITRARQELQISRAVYRDFRGRRRMPVPSRFLLELPREDMEIVSHEDDVACWDAVPEPLADRADGGAWEPERPSEPAGAVAAPRGKVRRASLVTAAELTGGRQPARVSPDDFTQGMVVRDPHNGLGHVVALTGSGEHRTATVDFVSPPCRVKFVLAQSRLQPLRPARPENP